MAQWRDFGSAGPVGEPGHCLWCGKKLRFKIKWKRPPADIPPVEYNAWQDANREYEDKPGDYSDGFFCNLRCGYQFGVRLAEIGRRLKRPVNA